MKVLQLSTILLLVVTSTSGQEHTVRKPLAAAISCTTEVPAKTCTIASGTFHAAQQASKAMFSVKVVLADERAFQQESDEEKKKFDISARSSSAALDNSKSLPLTPFGHSILFELGENGFISKVVICVDLFNEVGVEQLERTQGHARDPRYFDRNSAMTWATYVLGYVDGYYSSRMAATPENPNQKVH